MAVALQLDQAHGGAADAVGVVEPHRGADAVGAARPAAGADGGLVDAAAHGGDGPATDPADRPTVVGDVVSRLPCTATTLTGEAGRQRCGPESA